MVCWRCHKVPDRSHFAFRLGEYGLCWKCLMECEPRSRYSKRTSIIDRYSSLRLEHLKIACEPGDFYSSRHATRGRGWRSAVARLVKDGFVTKTSALAFDDYRHFIHATPKGHEELRRLTLIAKQLTENI